MSSRRGVRFTIRIVVPLSRRPTGRVFRLANETLDEEMRACIGPFALAMPTLGIDAIVYPQKPSDFTVRATIARVGPLERLRTLAESSNAGSERWFEDLAAAIGDAPYVTVLRGLARESVPPPANEVAAHAGGRDTRSSGEPGPAGSTRHLPTPLETRVPHGGSAPDRAAAGSATTRPRLGPAGAIDGVVRGARDDASAAGTKRVGRRIRDALGIELQRSVSLALENAPEERAWRALRWIATLLPKDGSILVEVADGTALELGWPQADVLLENEGPDLVVFASALDEEQLGLAATRADHTHTPVLASVARPDGSEAALPTTVTQAFPRLAELRARDESRWLALAANDVVLYEEGADTEATRRTLFGSATWGVLALVIASHRDTGGLGRVVGPAAQQRAPATWLPPSGRDAGTPLPTREFGSIRAQTEAASLGVTMLGSPRGGATIVLATAPTARASADACSFPAQVWVGKIVRFTRWALRSIPSDAPDDSIGELLSEAARGLLFPGLDRAARLGAHVEMRDDRSKRIVVEARMHASVAGEPLSLVFPMTRA